MKVLVTGGAGFIGSHACDALHDAGHNSVVFDNLETGKLDNLHDLSKREFLLFEGENIISSFHLKRIFEKYKPEVVIHLAAQAAISTSKENPVHDLEVNAKGTLNVIECALEFGVRRLIFASTSAVYDHRQIAQFSGIKEGYPLGPDTPYGISKLASEGYVRTLFPESVILRFGNVYGPRQVPIGENQVLSRMIRHFKYGDKFYIHGNGNQKRDFIYVSDVVSAITASLEGKPGTYNIATGESHSVNEIAKIVEHYYEADGYPWDHTEEEDPRRHVCLDITAAQSNLRWEPKVGFLEGIIKTIDWWQEHGEK